MKKKTVSERDNAYWDEYYASKNVPDAPSSFAKLILDKVDKSKILLELGCGNGRDSFFFGRNHIHTVALDLSEEAIKHNSSFEHENVDFKVADFTKLEDALFKDLGSVYSRFTLHSVDHDSYVHTINWCSRNIPKGGKFFIEARSTNDPLFGQGEKVGHNEFITTHYRRFMDIKEVMQDLITRGFDITYAVEDYVDSWYKDDHAVVLRIICEKI